MSGFWTAGRGNPAEKTDLLKRRWWGMLIGEYGYSIDIKGRLNFPAKLREDLGDRFMIAKGLGDHCLAVYSMAISHR